MPKVKLPSYTVAEVSTIHISKRDDEILRERWDDPRSAVPGIGRYEGGYILYTLPEMHDQEQWREDMKANGLSDEFYALWLLAAQQGHYLLRIDADGEVVEGLPKFEW